MAQPNLTSPRTRASSTVEVNDVLRNTYLLLGLTLAFSALTAVIAIAVNAPHPGFLITIIGFFGLLYAVHKTADSALGLLFTFIFTGFLGFIAGPTLNYYLNLSDGSSLVASALGTTAAAFIGLSAYAVITRKDFSFLSGFLVVGFFVLMGAVVLGVFFDLGPFAVAISCGFVLFSSAAILWQTSAIVHGGETNYIRATVTLYVSFYNLFMSLLHIFGAMRD